jgi:hypothetical protein
MAVGDTVSTAPEVLSYPVHTYPTTALYPAQPIYGVQGPSASVNDLDRQRVESLRLPLTLLVIHILASIPLLVYFSMIVVHRVTIVDSLFLLATAACCGLVALTGALMAIFRSSRAMTSLHLVVLVIVGIVLTVAVLLFGWFFVDVFFETLLTLDVFTASGLFVFTVIMSTLVGTINFYSYLIHTFIRLSSINCVQQSERTAIGTQAMPSFPPQITGF